MNTFFCALRVDAQPISRTELFGPIAKLPRNLDWQSQYSGAFAAMTTGPRFSMRPLQARGRGYIAVGDVRLDNRRELTRRYGIEDGDASDLDIVSAAIDQRG